MRLNFSSRHIGPSDNDIQQMLSLFQLKDSQELIDQAAPKNILSKNDLDLAEGWGEDALLSKAEFLANKNVIAKNYIGAGYYPTLTPTVIQRNILENPGWYTAYTPYQAEISQGRMEALLNFQTVVTDLTGLEIANASLLDEGTAIAEAVSMAYGTQKKEFRNKVFVDQSIFAQSLEILETRTQPLGLEVVLGDWRSFTPDDSYFAAVVQYPNALGEICDYEKLAEKIHSKDALFIVAADLLSLTVLKAPAEFGADIAVGTTQRFGVPLGFGGPHAAYFATKRVYQRLVPGRIIGASVDSKGRPALRLALQTREQHIRREKATSNICTAQVLLAVMASMYAVYHGPQGLKNIALRIHELTCILARELSSLGIKTSSQSFFDTISFALDTESIQQLRRHLAKHKINLWFTEHSVSISVDETKKLSDVMELVGLIAQSLGKAKPFDDSPARMMIPDNLHRKSKYLTHPVFNSYHSETEILRYIHSLEVKDLALNQAMIPLGSCTMKLNATTEMIPVTMKGFSDIHPFAPIEQAQGYMEMIQQLEAWLCQITGFQAVSLQPNAGSQGEYAGLLVIKKYQESLGQNQRDVCLIPSSAHGTNPASAVMAGMKVVVVKCDNEGNIDIADLKTKAEANKDKLAALMVTYPSTHGVYEEGITEIADIVHQYGGQVYMDGANLNALVGIARPGDFGMDVCHLNLHKTFCIPHGGGGPGMGPIGVAEHLSPFLPKHSLQKDAGPETGVTAISAAPWGSASILPISWAYIAMMGGTGLKKATEVAVLNANYIAKKLEGHYPLLFTNKKGFVAHECIIDVRPFKESAGITVDDIAKRLMDYGFHAPTMSWPVAGTLMIEPTESESKAELDRFCDAMISVRKEIAEIEAGTSDLDDNVLKNAPHTVYDTTADTWEHKYSREKAAFPLAWVRDRKFWPSVSRVDNAYGDRNLVCTCPAIEDYE